MAGHSKFKNIMHRKGAQDKKRAKIFSRLGREISVAVKVGGDDPESNIRLRSAIASAKGLNMPKENIERAIKKASNKSTENLKEMIFEGYAPYGIAVLIEVTSDNKNRSVANIRSYFNKAKGSMGISGSVDFMFERICSFRLNKENHDLNQIELDFIDFGVEDIINEDDEIIMFASFDNYGIIQKELEKRNIEIISSSFERIPISPKRLNNEQQTAVEEFIKKIEEDEDVQKVFHSMIID